MAKCVLCNSNEEDNIRYGEILKNDEVAVHTFCLYLTSNLCQRGEEDEDFYGFLTEDIKEEARRVFKLTCCYCSKRYANIGCCKISCRRSFHLICGIENGAQNQFINTYKSYCHQHTAIRPEKRPRKDEKCYICYDKLREFGERFNAVNMLIAPCCSNGWFHKLCLQKFAMSAGYFFKCPLCNDTKTFCKKLPYRGIFIPNRDASWELEPNAYAELLDRPSTCTAVVCRCLKGRGSTSNKNPLVICNACGSKAIHKYCLDDKSKKSGKYFYCGDCIFINSKMWRGSEAPDFNDVNDDTDEEVDVGIDKEECDNLMGMEQFSKSDDENVMSDDEVIRRSAVNYKTNTICDDDDGEEEENGGNYRTKNIDDDGDTSGISTEEDHFESQKKKRIKLQEDSDDEDIIPLSKIKLKFGLIRDSNNDEEKENKKEEQPHKEHLTIEEQKPANFKKNLLIERLASTDNSEDTHDTVGVVTKKPKIYHHSDSEVDEFKNISPYNELNKSLLINYTESESEDELQTFLWSQTRSLNDKESFKKTMSGMKSNAC